MEWLGTLPRVKRTNVVDVSAACVDLTQLDSQIHSCNACPRLVAWREEVAVVKRKAYEDQVYWGKAISGFGSQKPKILIVGLAPGAHGANRTGRIFTGDSSGDWLFGSLHRIGIAKIPTSTSREDKQQLKLTRITTAVHCAPPDNAPAVDERDRCQPWLTREFELTAPTVRAYVGLGAFAWAAIYKELKALGHPIPRVKFAHGANAEYTFGGRDYLVIASYHPSQQNTFTGKLTREMLDSVLAKAGRFTSVIT